jgi:cytochrome c
MKLDNVLSGAGCLFAASIALSTIHPWGSPRNGARPDAPLLEGSTAPESVRAILAAKCGNCHSERTSYPLYAHLAPVSWMLERDIHDARSHFNMSQWQSINDESRMSVLTRMASVVHSAQMPPRRYVMLHPGARLSPDDREQIYAWAKAERKRIRRELDGHKNPSATESGTGKQ